MARTDTGAPCGAEELETARHIFGKNNVGTHLRNAPQNSVVINRYLYTGPDCGELPRGAEWVNNSIEFLDSMDMFVWAEALGDLTAPVFDADDIENLPEGAYFVRGSRISAKRTTDNVDSWKKNCFAESLAELPEVIARTRSYLRQVECAHAIHRDDDRKRFHRVGVRPFQNFRKLRERNGGRPVFNEKRVFVLDGQVLAQGFWFVGEGVLADTKPLIDGEFEKILAEAVARTSHIARFYSIDLGELEDGSWQVIEIGDGSLTGLGTVDAGELWKNFKRVFDENESNGYVEKFNAERKARFDGRKLVTHFYTL